MNAKTPSVREWLANNLTLGCPAAPVFEWAAATGRARNTVLIQARSLGWRLNPATQLFEYAGQPPEPTEQTSEPPLEKRSGKGMRNGFDYNAGEGVVLSLAEWNAAIDKAARVVRLRGGDLLLMKNTPEGQRIALEIYDY